MRKRTRRCGAPTYWLLSESAGSSRSWHQRTEPRCVSAPHDGESDSSDRPASGRILRPSVELPHGADRLRPAAFAGVCLRYGIDRLEVFGLAARGDAHTGSDIDLLDTLAPGARLGWAIEDLTSELAQLLGRPVDLVSRQALHARLRAAVLAQAETLYAAA